MPELARVEIRMGESEYSDSVWCIAAVNGREWGNSVKLSRREDFQESAAKLQLLIETVYRMAYKEGRAEAQKDIREAIGLR